jgi:hypothetical protein
MVLTPNGIKLSFWLKLQGYRHTGILTCGHNVATSLCFVRKLGTRDANAVLISALFSSTYCGLFSGSDVVPLAYRKVRLGLILLHRT